MIEGKQSASPQKTEFVLIGQQRKNNEITDFSSLKLNDSDVKLVGKVIFLCVIVDEGLAWNAQFQSLVGKFAGGL